MSLLAAAACAGAFFVASAHAGRPTDPLRPRLLPWRSFMVILGAAGLLLVAHALGLLAPGLGAAAF